MLSIKRLATDCVEQRSKPGKVSLFLFLQTAQTPSGMYVATVSWVKGYWVGVTLSQATKALRESRGIALFYFRPLH